MRVFELAVSFGLILAGASQAATIFSTGVDNSGVALPLGGTDLHYTRTTAVTGPNLIVSNPPNAAWLLNSTHSQWVDDTGNRVLGATESYFTTFTGTGPSDTLSFFLGVDNNLTDILLNTAPLGLSLTGSGSSNFTALHLFKIDTGIMLGNNTLEFRLQNIGGDGGFRIDSAPEPASFGMVLLGGMAVLASRVRRRWNGTIPAARLLLSAKSLVGICASEFWDGNPAGLGR
jgi:hypothetical protein